jgi:hypothetical protein
VIERMFRSSCASRPHDDSLRRAAARVWGLDRSARPSKQADRAVDANPDAADDFEEADLVGSDPVGSPRWKNSEIIVKEILPADGMFVAYILLQVPCGRNWPTGETPLAVLPRSSARPQRGVADHQGGGGSIGEGQVAAIAEVERMGVRRKLLYVRNAPKATVGGEDVNLT